jgi:hypothetical protein
MTRPEFRDLLVRALNVAASNAEAKLGERVPRSFAVELHAPSCSGQKLSLDDAVDQLYLGSDRSYRIIDVAISEVLPDESVAFARVSGHSPVGLGETFDPSDLGPFKQVLAEHVKDRRVHSS